MRIVLCTETYFPVLNGVVTFVHMLAREWRAQGHEVLVVAADHTAKSNYIEDGVLHCPAIKSDHMLVDVAMPIDVIRFNMVRAFAPDVIHLQNEWGVGLFGLQTARLLRVPVVYTLHAEYSKFYSYAVKKFMIPFAAATVARLEKYIVKHTQVVTSPSYKAQLYFDSIGADVKVDVIQNGVELDEFDAGLFPPSQKLELRRSLAIPDEARCALFVGRMGPEKSVDVLLDYWAKTVQPNDRLHLMLIGGGPDDQQLRDQAKSLGIDRMVTFVGKVPHVQIAKYYAIADIYVTASLSEMHSVSMLEGMASGLPVLQRLDEPNRSQIIEGVNGWIFQTAYEFGRQLHDIRSLDEQQLGALKARVRASIEKNNSPKALAANYFARYEKAIELYIERKAPSIEELQ